MRICRVKLQNIEMKSTKVEIIGQIGMCGDREVFSGFARAALLSDVSFADIFAEGSITGYQRRFNRQHSIEFKKYIQTPGASTIPLTFNLRPEHAGAWVLERIREFPSMAILRISPPHLQVMSQVDCQHRLGYLADSNIEFAFMAYIGLNVQEEMAIFRDINGKAKGLNSSLLDSTEARLIGDKLSSANPELYHAMQLSENSKSPWRTKLDLGGTPTVGTKRAASLRTMQQAVKRFLHGACFDKNTKPEIITEVLIDFWTAITMTLPDEWARPRGFLLTKGIGVYSLMSLAGDLVQEAKEERRICNLDYFISKLSDFVSTIDWSNTGPMKGFGGVNGANAALELLRHARKKTFIDLGIYGKQTNTVN